MDWTGFLQDPGRDPVDSDVFGRNSTVQSMDLCPARVGYSLTDGFIDTPSEAMSFGTTVHAVGELTLRGVEDPHRLWLAPDLERLWVESLAEEGHDLHKLITKEKLQQSLSEAVICVAAWQQDVYPKLGELADISVEERVQKPLGVLDDGRAVWFHGTADLVDRGRGRIVDWKTANRGWDESKAHATGQASAYSWLYGIYEHEFWVFDRSRVSWSLIETSRTHAEVDSYLRHAWMRMRQVAAGVFPFTPWESTFGKYKRGWWCSSRYCAAWNVCEGKYLHDDVWEEQAIEVERGWE